MIQWLFPKLIGGKNEREINRIRPTVSRINEIEAALQREPDDHLRHLTANWQRHLALYHPLQVPAKAVLTRMDSEALQALASSIEARFSAMQKDFPTLPRRIEASVEGIENAKAAFHRIEVGFGKSRARYLDQILPDAYAVVKNAARRLCGTEVLVTGQIQTWSMVHFDVQLIGGIALHRGMIAEMQTGEGKTLVATLPAYLNALSGLGVHVVTVNDYLAQRDADWMGALFRFLGLSVGCIHNDMPPAERREAYACDITYGTNSEFGFDYLRDNGMARNQRQLVQRGHYLALIDEVDSILIDDARTPLIISGASGNSSGIFESCRPQIEQLVKRQTELCNGFAARIDSLLVAGDSTEAGLHLLKLKLGQPRNRRFLRFMEDPEIRRLLEKTELAYQKGPFQKDIFKLKEELYFVIDEKNHDADLMEKGRSFLAPGHPDSFTLPDINSLIAAVDANHALSAEEKSTARSGIRKMVDDRAGTIHGISQMLKAYCLYEKDIHYVVREDKVTIIDESTGREMPGRRWSDGLHQAVEAKERVSIEKETHTYATITIQNYFRLYEKLAGMTGTAETEAAEFHDIYQLDVLPIPTHRPNIRVDDPDQIFKTRREKFNAVIARIEEAHGAGQPVLVGTASVESSETLSRMLKRAAIPHSVLNAKFHQQEAAIVALAGRKGAVTVSTNMAGRGTDIKLGEGVAELGGLYVIGTERHSSRRVDRQLRGRCSRQGDPGRSQFFVSLEDDLMRHHASQGHMATLIEQAAAGDGKTLRQHSLGKLVETAQRLVEQRDYKSRKRVLDFDDVMNLQREIVYGYRKDVLHAEDTDSLVHDIIRETITHGVSECFTDEDAESRDTDRLLHWIRSVVPGEWTEDDILHPDPKLVIEAWIGKTENLYKQQIRDLPREHLDELARFLILSSIDDHWQRHLDDMDELREGVYLRAQGQKDPLVEYKNEAYELFVILMERVREDAMKHLFRLSPAPSQEPESVEAAFAHDFSINVPPAKPVAANARNQPCSCGSGKKSKHCCASPR
jgi:preprotein translocase subunit SecA